jgi:hypothetical protein
MPKVYAFDVDECLETSNGPITVAMLKALRAEGHILGINGNLSAFLPKCPDWHTFISFTMNFDFGINPAYRFPLVPKAVWLHCFQHVAFPGADEYVMVGNIFGEKNSLGVVCGSHDNTAAEVAGWRFIKEDDFAKGAR